MSRIKWCCSLRTSKAESYLWHKFLPVANFCNIWHRPIPFRWTKFDAITKKWANPVPFLCTSLIKSLFNNKCLLPLVKEKRETKAYDRQNSPCRAYASLHQLLNRSCCESLWRDVRAAKNVCSPFVCEHLKVKSSPAKGFDLLFHFSFLLVRIFQSCQ